MLSEPFPHGLSFLPEPPAGRTYRSARGNYFPVPVGGVGSQDEWRPQQPMARRARPVSLGVANGQGRGRGVGSRARSRGGTGPWLWGRDRAAVERRRRRRAGEGPAEVRAGGARGWAPGRGGWSGGLGRPFPRPGAGSRLGLR